jgi:hypothetical protein
MFKEGFAYTLPLVLCGFFGLLLCYFLFHH